MAVLLPLLIVSIFGGLLFLQASSFWYKKDIVRAIIYASGGMFLVMSTTFYSTVTSVELVMNQMLEEHGYELRQPAPPQADIPDYRR